MYYFGFFLNSDYFGTKLFFFSITFRVLNEASDRLSDALKYIIIVIITDQV